MFVGNRLKAGDFVTFVPLGLPVTLQYDASGNLEKVYYGYSDKTINLSEELLPQLINHPSVPYHISITKSTTWVRGVLYTSKVVEGEEGWLPVAIYKRLVEMFIEDAKSFNFFAATVENVSTQFRGAVAVRQWLNMSKFHTLPGLIVTTQFNEAKYKDFVNSQSYTFRPELVQGFFVFRQDMTDYIDNRLYQHAVSDISTEVDKNGYVHSMLKTKAGALKIDYSEAVRNDVQPDSIVVTSELNGNIQFTHCSKGKSITWPKQYECQYCHKYIPVPASGSLKCDNPHCKSNLLIAVKQFLAGMYMPQYDDDVIHEWIESDSITCIPDLFIIPEYAEFKVQTTLSKLLRSVVPYSIIRDSETLELFVNKCSNKVDVFEYYIEHPDKIQTELKLSGDAVGKLVAWLGGEYNFIDLQTLLHTENIQFTDTNKAFLGAPIFRGKVICITGRFTRGTHTHIAEILRSYDASVVEGYNEEVSLVILGGTREDLNGQIIHAAQKDNKLVMTEDAFFNHYDIDADIQQNLV